MTGTFRRKKGTSDKWVLTARFGYDPKGKEIRRDKTVKARNKSEAQHQLGLWLSELEKYDVNTESATLTAFSKDWLTKYAAMEKLAPRTVDSYRRLIDRYIQPNLGNVALKDITPAMITDFLAKLLTEKRNEKQRRSNDKRLSPLTVKSVYYLFGHIMRTAYRLDQIPSNPMEKVDPPKGKPKAPKIFKAETIRQLFIALTEENHTYQLLILLDLTTGCREGEVLGLSWNDYDEEAHTIHVHQTVQYTPGKGTYLYPHTKTENSQRDIYVIPQLRSMLKEARSEFEHIKEHAGKQWNPYDLIFYLSDGTPMRPNTISNWFTNFIRRHHIEAMRFHDLRGYFATQLMINGHSLPDIIKRTGHSKASTLLDYYGHAIEENKEVINQSITTTFDNIKKISS
ncbi:site-specific integrase [Megasphaera paucivorans]|uniref:Site-specific recombinase XerD n=1 Tax=Megasphaera paucivorans TaxID=349095 RepID=A0A1G9X0J6_9FIRM|nr:site-specific integrase [Megasphaera paucivorans]SDM90021.1 Site-specific recombinase XerD [Megasphaera paucivorans]